MTTALTQNYTASTATRATAPTDISDRSRTRAARKERPQPRRTGKLPSPHATTKPAPPERSPSPTPTPEKSSAPSWVVPTSGYSITSGYGTRWGTLHAGVDLAAPSGTTVVAAHEGTVELAEWYGGYGNAVIIDHGDGVKTLYGHNSALHVSAGAHVSAGQQIASVGSTGDSTGPHLHFEVHLNGETVDPIPYLADRGVRL